MLPHWTALQSALTPETFVLRQYLRYWTHSSRNPHFAKSSPLFPPPWLSPTLTRADALPIQPVGWGNVRTACREKTTFPGDESTNFISTNLLCFIPLPVDFYKGF